MEKVSNVNLPSNGGIASMGTLVGGPTGRSCIDPPGIIVLHRAHPMKTTRLPLIALIAFCPFHLAAQCPVGEVEVTINVTTDDYGYESYWELTPSGDPCGTNTIGSGGNTAVGCAGGGLQLQAPGGYGNNTVNAEGPWCLTEGASYDIHAIDDWGDGQCSFEVFVDGVSIGQFGGNGAVNIWTFIAQPPQARDMSVTQLTTPIYTSVAEGITVRGVVKTFGSDPVNSFDLNYSIDGGAPVVQNVTGVAIVAGDTIQFAHNVPWVSAAVGTYSLEVWASNINGGSDLVPANDLKQQDLIIGDLTRFGKIGAGSSPMPVMRSA